MIHRPRVLTAALLATVALAAVTLALRDRSPGARFQGHGVNYWFPRWTFPWSQADDPARQAALRSAGPEILSLLIAAMTQADSQVLVVYRDLVGRLPHLLADRAPAWHAAQEVAADARDVLVGRMGNGEFERELLVRADELPAGTQVDVTIAILRQPQPTEIGMALLGHFRDSTNDFVAFTASEALFRLLPAGDARLPASLERLAELPEQYFYEGTLRQILNRVITLGPGVPALEAWMKRWLESAHRPNLRIAGALALAALAPERYPVREVLAPFLPFRSSTVVGALTFLGAPMDRGRHPQEAELAALLAPLLAPERALEIYGSRPGKPEFDEGNAHAAVLEPALRWFRDTGKHAGEAVPFLPSLLASSRPQTAGLAAEVLAVAGPNAPDTIPALVGALDRTTTAPALIMLLASYGPQARAAVPRLREIAAGTAQIQEERPDQSRFQMSPELMRRYGLLRQRSRAEPGPSGRITVEPATALRLNLTHVWPLPPEQRGLTNLWWGQNPADSGSGSPRPSIRSGTLVQPVTLAALAAEALRRIEGTNEVR